MKHYRESEPSLEEYKHRLREARDGFLYDPDLMEFKWRLKKSVEEFKARQQQQEDEATQ